MGMKLPGMPEIPDCSGVMAAGEALMKVAAKELPRLVTAHHRKADALERIAEALEGK